MKRASQFGDESGMALLTTLMVLILASALMVGFFAAIVADQRANGIDRDQTQAYAASHAGLEKLTSDLATLFETDFNPTSAQINALATRPPTIPGFTYIAPGGVAGSGYAIAFSNDGRGNPAPLSTTGTPITAGPFQGFNGIITQYTITSTARSSGGAEVRLRRLLETVAVPVFQFGVFSETDLSFFAGPNFAFGGRVHTNGNLYLEEGAGNTLTVSDRITTAGEVIRRELSNGYSTRVNAPNYTGTINLLTAPGTFRAMGLDEGSVKDGMGPPTSSYPLVLNELPVMNPGWTSISKGTYKSYIMSSRTGGKRLDLPLVSQIDPATGLKYQPIELIRRPVVNENVVSPLIYPQRFYTTASLRILLSDTAAEITGLPGITATPPVPLDGSATVAQYGPVDATHPPFARSPGLQTMTTNALTAANAGVAGTISVNGPIPAFFRPQVVRINGFPLGGVMCAGRTATSFIGCAVGLPLSVAGATVGAQVNSGAGVINVSTTLTAGTALNATTLPVVSTGAFAPGIFWADLPANVPPVTLLVTCTGSNIAQNQLTGCAGNTVALPNGALLSTNALANAGESLIGGLAATRGYIKIEAQNAAGVWSDVTTEILNLGIASRNQLSTLAPGLCPDPNPNAVIRLQRLRDNANGDCSFYRNSINANDYWPNALYDTREGNLRDDLAITSPELMLGGAMYFVELDVNNLRRWLLGLTGASGLNVVNQNGYIVYFSDRRNNKNAAGVETGEYGFEDFVNPVDINGQPNDILDAGEDVNSNGILETYGQMPVNLPAGAASPLTAAARTWKTTVGGVIVQPPDLMVNRPIFFRRALKLVRGGIGDTGVANQSAIPQPGFTVASENPVYIQGNYNASSAAITNAQQHFACAILADAVTLLSNNWNDANSFRFVNDPASRPVNANTGYRVAIAAGKGLSFKQPVWAGVVNDFGTDGGAHNFLRYLERWGANNLNYTGSLVSLFYSRQAVGTFKCCNNVYSPPVRVYNFDTDFLLPALLPPGTPMFRDVNTLTFRQLLRPNQ